MVWRFVLNKNRFENFATVYIIYFLFEIKNTKKIRLYMSVMVVFVIISVKENNKFVTNKFWWVRLNRCDDQNNSLNILIIKNWKKLKIKIKEISSSNDMLL